MVKLFESEVKKGLIVAKRRELLGTPITLIYRADGTKLPDISRYIQHPEHYRGDPTNVDFIVDYRNLFARLVGRYDPGVHGEWNPQELLQEGIFTAEDFDYNSVRDLAFLITLKAGQLFANPNLYHNKAFTDSYLNIIKKGYMLSDEIQKQVGLSPIRNMQGVTDLMILTAGYGAIKGYRDLPINYYERLPNAVAVNGKRFLMSGQKTGDMAVAMTIEGNRESFIEALDGKIIAAPEVVLASGASFIAVGLIAEEVEAQPAQLILNTFAASKQGTLLTHEILTSIGINHNLRNLASNDELNNQHYLIGDTAVGDAGDVVRGSSWFNVEELSKHYPSLTGSNF